MSSPPRWYPDPSGRHQYRYWDGGCWTEHVRDNGTLSVDPSLRGRRSRDVYVDMDLQAGFLRSERLFVDDQGLSWGDLSLSYDQVTSIAYWVKRPAVGDNRFYEFRLWLHKGTATIRFFGPGENVRAGYDGLVRALLARVGRPLVTRVLERIEAGESVEFGSWTLNREMAAHGRKHVLWTTPIDFLPTTEFSGGWWVRDRTNGKKKIIGMILFDVANGPLVRQVFEVCIDRYGG